MRRDSSEGGYRDLVETFETLARQLDKLMELNAADGADPEVAARLKKAKALALHGSSKLREHLDQPSDDQSQRFG